MKAGNSMSLRARINNLAKTKGISPQLALQSFFAERFLARIEKSRYSKNLALKGGTLMSVLFGLEQRTTMDIDATVVGMRADETKIAEKLQTILKRGVGTTRPRDFYDLHMICKRGNYDRQILSNAVLATFENRASMEILANWREVVEAIKGSDFQRQQWERYKKKVSYAANIAFDEVISSLVGFLTATSRK